MTTTQSTRAIDVDQGIFLLDLDDSKTTPVFPEFVSSNKSIVSPHENNYANLNTSQQTSLGVNNGIYANSKSIAYHRQVDNGYLANSLDMLKNAIKEPSDLTSEPLSKLHQSSSSTSSSSCDSFGAGDSSGSNASYLERVNGVATRDDSGVQLDNSYNIDSNDKQQQKLLQNGNLISINNQTNGIKRPFVMSASLPIKCAPRQMRRNLGKLKKLEEDAQLESLIENKQPIDCADDEEFLEEFNANHRNYYEDCEEENLRADTNPEQLFESIRALARSLHKDTELFGSLPPKARLESPIRTLHMQMFA